MAKVYFSDMRTPRGSLPKKLRRLIDLAGLGSMDLENKFVAIKLHFGEPGNLAFLRPNWAKVVADYVAERGGIPFLTDCNTLYVGRRKHAIEHITSAYENGFTPFSTGCHVIIADGLKGTDEAVVPMDGDYVKEAKIGRALYDADVIISLNHFKGHEQAGFGGALKNLGMGGGSRAGKMEMHYAGKPDVDQELCIGCGRCAPDCAHDAISISDRKAHVDMDKCVGCGHCIGLCNQNAIVPTNDEALDILNRKIAEYTYAVLKNKPSFHISLAIDVSPHCDCWGKNDVPIVPDVGMFASFDPIALDQACADKVNAAPAMPDSVAACSCSGDHFAFMYPETCWQEQLIHGEKLGLGSREYELVEV